MNFGMAGLGRMGASMARRLMKAGHACVGFDLSAERVAELARDGARPARSLEELAAALPAPRRVWLMLPAGEATEAAIDRLASLLSPGDAVIDGSNGRWSDDPARARRLAERGVGYADAGTSGGVWGLERGYCLMIGCEPALFAELEPLFAALAPGEGAAPPTPGRPAGPSPASRGYLRCGGPGSGHYAKMVHNAIEYGLMQAYAEGLALAKLGPHRLDAGELAEVWRRGSVISSWLLDLTAAALAAEPELESYSARVEDSGEGRWAMEAALGSGVPAPALAAALFERFRSRLESSFADRALSAMRAGFGGHGRPPAGR